jgi:hypothetical protein
VIFLLRCVDEVAVIHADVELGPGSGLGSVCETETRWDRPRPSGLLIVDDLESARSVEMFEPANESSST